MAAPRKHHTDEILDAARALVLRKGPRAASVSAIAAASGAPAGTLYHRFGSRDGVLAAAWLRALERFQARALEAAGTPGGPVEAGVALATATIAFARELPEDARLLLSLRRGDLLDASPGPDFRQRLDELNAPLIAAIHGLATELNEGDERTLDAVTLAVVDLPYAAVRRHAPQGRLPDWLEHDVGEGTRGLLARATPPAS